MKVIITEKASMARELARIVGATHIKEGYIEGNGYAVTWTTGHLVTIALPGAYAHTELISSTTYSALVPKGTQLPILPKHFRLVPRQVKSEKRYRSDAEAVAQLRVIKRLFTACEQIIVATDPSREGEQAFRYIYEYLGCAKPFERLWISSFTDKSIRKGLANLKCGAEYDNLYYAARAGNQADWLVEVNANQAVATSAGRGTYPLGRLLTPTLAMVCARFWENRNFVPERFWTMSVGVLHEGEVIQLASSQKWHDKQEVDLAYESVQSSGQINVTSIERRECIEESPLLYNLTDLQKEANAKHGFSAEKTLAVAQDLFEAGLITYPRTGNTTISESDFAGIRPQIKSLKSHPNFGSYAKSLSNLSRRSVCQSKSFDHPAMLITGLKLPKAISAEELTIYNMIAGRMLEALSDRCVKRVTTITAECVGVLFSLAGSTMLQQGWRGVYGEGCEEHVVPQWKLGKVLTVGGCSISECTTQAEPLRTQASLLSAMERFWIGTPASRSEIIETLIERDCVVLQSGSLMPIERGLALYSVVKSMRIADAEFAGAWESALAKVESGELRDDVFIRSFGVYAEQITAEIFKSPKLFPRQNSR